MLTYFATRSRERRKRPRLTLAYPLRLFRARGQPQIDTKTEDVSSQGVFCFSPERFSLMETLDGEIVISPTNGHESRTIVRCRLEVVRVIPIGPDGIFGIGFRLCDYTITTHAAQADTSREVIAEQGERSHMM
ncbi:MAG TPA: PilZ domain-containing protein [Blastocatellia bacterium]|nr:PilZ domain-containing protein [Blastocatellia bacterium]